MRDKSRAGLRLKDTRLRLNIAELTIIKAAIDMAREAMGDWLEDPRTDSADIRFAKKQLRDFATLELKLGGYPLAKSGERTIVPFPESARGEVA
jgi:hypothetical protein